MHTQWERICAIRESWVRHVIVPLATHEVFLTRHICLVVLTETMHLDNENVLNIFIKNGVTYLVMHLNAGVLRQMV